MPRKSRAPMVVLPDGKAAFARSLSRVHFWRPLAVTLLEAWPLGLGGPFFNSDGQSAVAWQQAEHEVVPPRAA